jgi:peptide/nickel transport system substrate-binding protein
LRPLICLLPLAALGAACTAPAAPTATGGQNGTTMVIADSTEPTTLDPLAGFAPYGAAKIFDGLLEHQPGGALAPALAETVPEPEADGVTYLVHLRKNIKFSNGTPFGADDVVATYRKLLDPSFGSPLRSDYSMLRSVRKVDNDTVTFKLAYPYLPFNEKLALGISPSEQLAKASTVNRSPVAAHPIGTGPYRLGSWRKGRSLVLRANDRYIQGRPKISTIRVLFGRSDAERLDMARKGQIDAAAIPPNRLNPEAPPNEFGVFTQRSAEFRAVSMPEANPVTHSLAVRRALNYVVDRQRLVNEVLSGQGAVASTPVTGVALEFVEPGAQFGLNTGLAGQLLSAAGWKPGDDGVRQRGGVRASIPLCYSEDDSQAQRLAEQFAADAKQIGIEVKPVAAPDDELPQRAGRSPVLFGAGNPFDPDLSLYPLLHSVSDGGADGQGSEAAPKGDRPGNWSGYSDRAVDAALEAGRRQADPAQRAVAYRELQRAYVADPAMVVLARLDRQYVLRESWSGYTPVTDAAGADFTWGPWWNVEHWTRE